ncbi:MAG: hypothetical protein RMK16_08510 [Acidobacteriota bacterium]|nr:hypothetical protein [Acidobacteriota bacterium]
MSGNPIDEGFCRIRRHPSPRPVPLPEFLEEGAIIADALTMPFHAVVYQGQARPRDRVAVIGYGGIGLNAVRATALQVDSDAIFTS